MAGSIPIPPDATVGAPPTSVAVPIPPDATVGDSVFDTPTTPPTAAEIPGRVSELGKSAIEAGSGLVTAQGGTMAGTEIGGALGGPPGALAGGLIGSAVGGGAAPVVEAGAAKAMGENAVMPTTGEIISSAGLNLGFHALGELGAARSAKLRAAGARDLPIEQTNSVQVKQLAKNRDFWKTLGVSDEQIDSIMARPDAEKLLQTQVQAGNKAKQAFQKVADETRAGFNQQYETLLGPHADVKTPVQDIAQTLNTLSQGTESGQHELTPSFQGFLARKAKELSAPDVEDPLAQFFSPDELKSMTPNQRKGYLAALPQKGASTNIAGVKGANYRPTSGQAEPVVDVPQPRQLGIQDIRDLRTELGENLPTGATPLDRKAYAQVNQLLNDRQDSMLAQSGATPEQIGGLHDLDQKWGQFQTTLKALRPDAKDFGADVSNTLWSDAGKSPTLALNLINMAQAAEKARPGEVMPQLRESFLSNLQAQARMGEAQGGPVQEMKVLRKVQDQWRGSSEGQAVLDSMFGKESPMADPTTMSNVLGRLDDPNSRNKFVKMMESAGPSGWLVRGAALAGIAGGSIYTLQSHPDRALPIAATLLTLGVAGPLLARMNAPAQRAYVKFIMTPEPNTFRSLLNVAGASVTGLSSQPNTQP